jgi:hypothetical protein
MPPPTRNIAAVPTTASVFMSIGAPRRIARPSARAAGVGATAQREAAIVELDDARRPGRTRRRS